MKVARDGVSLEVEGIALKTPSPTRRSAFAPVHFPEITTPKAKQRLLGEGTQRFHGAFCSINHFVNHRALPLEDMSCSSKKSNDKVDPKVSEGEACNEGKDKNEIFLSNGNKYIYKPSYREAAIACYKRHNLLQRTSNVFEVDMSASQLTILKKLKGTSDHCKKEKRSVASATAALCSANKIQVSGDIAFPKRQPPRDTTSDTGDSKILEATDATCENWGKTRVLYVGETTDISSSVTSIYLQTFNVPEPPPNSQNTDTVSETEVSVEVAKETVPEPRKLDRKLKKMRPSKELGSKALVTPGEQLTRKNISGKKRETRNNANVSYPREPLPMKKRVAFLISPDSPNRNALPNTTREKITPQHTDTRLCRCSCPSSKLKSPANSSDIRSRDKLVLSDAPRRWIRPIFEVRDGNLDALSLKTFLISKMTITPVSCSLKDDPLLLGHLFVHRSDRIKWSNPPTLFKIGLVGGPGAVPERNKGSRKSSGDLILSIPKDRKFDLG